MEDPLLRSCIERLAALRDKAPRRRSHGEAYIMEWAWFKRRVAEEAARCLTQLYPGIREVYYIEPSDDYAGRDIDLLVVFEREPPDPSEARETLEAVLEKLVSAAGLELHRYTVGSRPFEIHHGEPRAPLYKALLARSSW